MTAKNIDYYKIKRLGGMEYIAAESEEAILKYLGNPENPTSIAFIFKYDLKTLEKITEEEAKKAPYFWAFAKRYQLGHDKTFVLGMPGVENSHMEVRREIPEVIGDG